MPAPHNTDAVLEVRTVSATEILKTGAFMLLGASMVAAAASQTSGMSRLALFSPLIGVSLGVLVNLLVRRPRRPYSLSLTREFLFGPDCQASGRSKVPVTGLPLGPLERAGDLFQFTPSTVRLVASDGSIVEFRARHFPRARLRDLLAALRSLQAGAA